MNGWIGQANNLTLNARGTEKFIDVQVLVETFPLKPNNGIIGTC